MPTISEMIAYTACNLCQKHNSGTEEFVEHFIARDQARFQALNALKEFGDKYYGLGKECLKCDYKSPKIAEGLEKAMLI
jgi:hypothetical protein